MTRQSGTHKTVEWTITYGGQLPGNTTYAKAEVDGWWAYAKSASKDLGARKWRRVIVWSEWEEVKDE